MNEIAAAGGRLTIVCIGCALIVGLFSFFLKPRIEHASLHDVRGVLPSVSSDGNFGTEHFVKDSQAVQSYFIVKNGKGKIGGYILRSRGKGYGGDFSLVASYSPAGEILAVRLLENKEISPAASRADTTSYLKIFIGTGGKKPVPAAKSDLGLDEADTVTGSTVTFLQLSKVLKESSLYAAALGGAK